MENSHQESKETLHEGIARVTDEALKESGVKYEHYVHYGGTGKNFEPSTSSSHPHSPIGWRERFDEEYEVVETGNYSEQIIPNANEKRPIKSFIAQELEKERNKSFDIGVRVGKNAAVDYMEECFEIDLLKLTANGEVIKAMLEAARSTKEV